MEENNSFLGRGWGFPITFNRTGSSVSMVEDEEDIRQSLQILLLTMKRERVLLPDYGTDLQARFFEPLSTTAANALTEEIRRAIIFHESRVDLDRIKYDQDLAGGKITLDIQYTIVATNTRTNLVFPFYFIEGTDLA